MDFNLSEDITNEEDLQKDIEKTEMTFGNNLPLLKKLSSQ
jgi:hypothetical protein